MIMFEAKMFAAAALLAASTGCGSSASTEQLKGWLGSELHLVAEGRLADEDVAIDIHGATAADVAQLWCDREYRVPMVGGQPNYAEGMLPELAINGFVSVGASQRRFEIEFKEYAFRDVQMGTKIEVIPRDDTEEPGPSQMWFEWEWHQVPSDDELLEVAAQTGTVEVDELSGTPDETGLIIPENEGTFGGFVEARWTESEMIRMSFTVRCANSDVELVE